MDAFGGPGAEEESSFRDTQATQACKEPAHNGSSHGVALPSGTAALQVVVGSDSRGRRG